MSLPAIVPKEATLLNNFSNVYDETSKKTKKKEEKPTKRRNLSLSAQTNSQNQNQTQSPSIDHFFKNNHKPMENAKQKEGGKTIPNNSVRVASKKSFSLKPPPFPDLKNLPSIQKACADENPLTEAEIESLRSEIETLRKNIKEFGNHFQKQMEVLEQSGEKMEAQPNRDGKIRKRKKESQDGDYRPKKEESASEDEIDVVDVVEEAGNADLLEEGNAVDGRGRKSGKVERKKSSGIQQKGKRNRQKISKDNKRSRSKKHEDYSSGEEIYYAKGYGKNNFWADMEPYFALFTEEDLKFCEPESLEHDKAFVIPSVGKHYKEVWEEEDNNELEDQKVSTPTEDGEQFLDGQVGCGDLTQRILAALIEENIVPPSETQESNPPSFQPCLPLQTPPTYDYSYVNMLTLEERIKKELQSIGLLDDNSLEASGHLEDDELCIELRKLQEQLREQIVANNSIRSKLKTAVQAELEKKEEETKRKIENANIEKTYMKIAKKKRKA